MLRSYALRSVLVVATWSLSLVPIRAQQVIIPDANFRAWLNSVIPGAVDADGFLDTELPAVQTFNTTGLSINWEPYDLTGLEYLTGLDFLYLHCNGRDGVIPAFPPSLTWLAVIGYNGSQLPAIPSGVEVLHVQNGPLAVQPAYPESLQFLQMGALNLSTIGPFPASMTQLKLAFVWPMLEEVVGLPEGLDTLLMNGFPENVNFCLPQLPDGMTFLGGDILEGEPFDCLPNVPTNAAFHSNWPLPPLCESDDVCALSTGLADDLGPLSFAGPNPVREVLVLDRSTSELTHITIVDATGRVVLAQPASGALVMLDVSGFAPGHYTVTSTGRLTSAAMRFMKE